MRKWIIGAGVTIAALALGVGAAYGGSQLIKTYRPQIREAIQNVRGNLPSGKTSLPETGRVPDLNGFPGMRNGGGNGPMQGMRDRMEKLRDRVQDRRNRNSETRITLDQAVQAAQTYAAGLGANFSVAEVMEFERNFYAVILEKDSGRGAQEVLIDPYDGWVTPEPGPNMMWNLKYGRMHAGSAQTGDNAVTLDQARQAAQEYLDPAHPGAKLNGSGYSFYGYYTFDYSVDGKTAGMLSVNGTTRQVWEHTWHGTFVAEKEMTQ
jgi:hypothetical protein